MTMTEILQVVVLVALLAAWMVSLMAKVGIVEWMQVHGTALISEMASCDFCLSWWSCVVVSLVVALCCGEWCYVLVPFLATPITRRLI